MRRTFHAPPPPILEVRFQGSRNDRELLALLDTGASDCVVTPRLAKFLGYDLNRAVASITMTAGGVRKTRDIILDRIDVGPFRRHRVRCVVLELRDDEFEAILGWSILESFKIMIEPRKGIVTLDGSAMETMARTGRRQVSWVFQSESRS